MPPRVAVIGNVDWTDYVPLAAVPEPGRRLRSHGASEAPGATAAVLAAQLMKLGAQVELFTALADDDDSARVEAYFGELGIAVFAARRPAPHTRSVALLHLGAHERSLIALGPRRSPRLGDPLPWARLDAVAALVFTSGDEALLERARAATGLLVVHGLAAEVLAAAPVRADILVGSALDEDEAPVLVAAAAHADVVVETLADAGGRYSTPDGRRGTWAATPLTSPPVDSYGCGASFLGGLTFGLAGGKPLVAALDLGAQCGASCLCGQGPFVGQLRL